MTISSALRRTAAVSTVAAVGLIGALGFAGVAGAHVTVRSYDDPPQGGYGALTFRVPTERDDASTTKVQVTMPAANPIASVSVKRQPGWTATLAKGRPAKPLSSDDGPITEVVKSITWKASSAATAIKPGQFNEFEVSAGPMPKVAELRFPTIQIYSTGEVVKWNETAAKGAPEPEHPAPSLELKAASADAAPAAVVTTTSSTTEKKNGGTTTTVLAIAALVIAIGAAGAGALAFRKKSTA